MADTGLPVLGESRGRRAILVAGVVQSVAPEDAASGYWSAMLPRQRPTCALLLGVGGGTIARLLVARFGQLPIIGVDESAAVLDLGREAFGPLPSCVRLVQADALAYVHAESAAYDYICVDLYRGDRLPRGLLALPFLRALTARLTPRGTIVFNLFADAWLDSRVAKLERVFERDALERVGGNAIFHGRARGRHRRVTRAAIARSAL